jgi:diacylglycerol O-acyltransferase / wax synthase
MAREKMSMVDTAWLRMDSDSNLMMIVGIHVFETPVAFSKLQDLVTDRLLKYRRFKQRVEIEPTGAWWADDSHFELGHHVRQLHLLPSDPSGGAGTDRDLQDLVSKLAMEPLDPDRPLWQFCLVENYQGSNALIARIHHCIADGIALVAVTMSLTDSADLTVKARSSSTSASDNPWHPYIQPLTKGTIKAISASSTAWSTSLQILAQPDRLVDYAQIASQVIKDAAKIALMPNDSSTKLKGKLGTTKAVAWNKPLPLEEVKAVCKVLGCSINDVLLSCVAGALRSYLLRHEAVPADTEIRAMVPVNLRAQKDAHLLGNKFGLVPLTLPVGMVNPVARVLEVQHRMNELKQGFQAHLSFGVLGLVGATPKPVQKQVLDILARKATAVMTNVPGPQTPLYVAGVKVKQMLFWVPQSGDIGVGVSILSYNGGVQFGVITDTELCDDPQAIIEAFEPEFDKLVYALALSPPSFFDGTIDPQQIEDALFFSI